MAYFYLTSPHLMSTSTKELAVMAQTFPLKLPCFFVYTQEMESAQQYASSLFHGLFFSGDMILLLFFTSMARTNIIRVHCDVVVLLRPENKASPSK